MVAIKDGKADRALWAMQAQAVCCYQFLTPDDFNYSQAIKYAERLCIAAGRSKACNPHLA
jgi:hypothetical protein